MVASSALMGVALALVRLSLRVRLVLQADSSTNSSTLFLLV